MDTSTKDMSSEIGIGPLQLVNFHQTWSNKFENYDVFFDNASNFLVFHNEGAFIIYE
jgi:hypothetical protein